MKELIEKVKQWGLDRGIVYTGADGQDKRAMMESQARYTLKETAELLDACADQDINKINDAVGDILVTLIVGASSDDDIYKRLVDELDEYNFDDPYSEYGASLNSVVRVANNTCYLISRIQNNSVVWFDYDCCVDSLFRTLSCVNSEYNQSLTLKDCLSLAYDEIKNRKGKVVNGQFIKE